MNSLAVTATFNKLAFCQEYRYKYGRRKLVIIRARFSFLILVKTKNTTNTLDIINWALRSVPSHHTISIFQISTFTNSATAHKNRNIAFFLKFISNFITFIHSIFIQTFHPPSIFGSGS